MSCTVKNSFNATPSQKEVDAFVGAARDRNSDRVLEFLNKYKNSVDAMSDGATALRFAAIYGHIDMIILLLKNGASIDKKDANGMTPLMCAALNNYTDVVALLLEKGAAINEKSNSGSTALMYAAHAGRKNTVVLLLKNGANLDEKNNTGDDAVALTKKSGEAEVAGLLLTEQKTRELAAEIADFSPALKRAIPAPHPIKVPQRRP